MPVLMVCPHAPDVSAAVVRLAQEDPELLPDFVNDETDLRYSIVQDCIEDEVIVKKRYPTARSVGYHIPAEPDLASCGATVSNGSESCKYVRRRFFFAGLIRGLNEKSHV